MKLFSVWLLWIALLGDFATSSYFKSQRRLIKTSETGRPIWLSEKDILRLLIEKGKPFFDITDHQDFLLNKTAIKNFKGYPSRCVYQKEAKPLLAIINNKRMETFIRHFSSYHTRFFNSSFGVESQKWLFLQVQTAIQDYTASSASAKEFHHKQWLQKSIIARIEGSDSLLKSEVIVFGAHQDSKNILGETQNAPGAIDNASGSVALLEALRVLTESGFAPKRTIEFHWYAGEEYGLLGSSEVAKAYRINKTNVVAMLNFDTVGYRPEGVDVIGIFVDPSSTRPDLNKFLLVIADEYLTFGTEDAKCGYGCSDHVPWADYGFSTGFLSSKHHFPKIHTPEDNIESVSFVQIHEFVKLLLGVIVEYGMPNSFL